MDDEQDLDRLAGLLGRLPAADRNDQRYPLAAIMGDVADQPLDITYKHWRAPPALDQGRTSSCVGHGVHQLLKCSPIRNIKNIPDPIWIYNQAQLIDEFPGIDPAIEGTSLRAGVKIAQREGYVKSYHWCWDIETANRYILTTGPLLLGVMWTAGMFKPDKNGFIYPTGRAMGGHCVLEVGLNLKEKAPDGRIGTCSIVNHWGLMWGRKGRAKMVLEDMAFLLREGGEAVAVQEILKPQPAVS
jgi:hypothetical protein